MKEFKLPRITTQITTHIATQVKLLLGCKIFALAIGLAITLVIGLAIALDFKDPLDVKKFESKVSIELRESMDMDIWTAGIKQDYGFELISLVVTFQVAQIREEPNNQFTVFGVVVITTNCKDQNGLSKQVVSIRYMALLVSSDYEIIESKILSIIPMRVIRYGTES